MNEFLDGSVETSSIVESQSVTERVIYIEVDKNHDDKAINKGGLGKQKRMGEIRHHAGRKPGSDVHQYYHNVVSTKAYAMIVKLTQDKNKIQNTIDKQ